MVDPRITYTPNLKLTKLPENFHVWAQIMNDNLTMVDAAVSGFIVFNNLRGAWSNSTVYAVGDSVIDTVSATIWSNQVAHTSSSIPDTFLQERTTFPTYWSLYTAAAHSRGAWSGPGTSYVLNDFVVANGVQYAVCIASHISSASFTADTAAGKWTVLVDLSAAGSLVLPTLGGAIDANKVVITNVNGTAYSINTVPNILAIGGATTIGMSLLTTPSQAAARSAINAVDATGATTFGLSLLTLADINALIAQAGGSPTGVIQAFAGTVIPTGWLLCAGQTVSRTTFANLFATVGTTYNTGGEAGTDFRLPDGRGRVIAGLDNMGGSAASRLTNVSISPNATTMGAVGGTQQNAASTFVSITSGGATGAGEHLSVDTNSTSMDGDNSDIQVQGGSGANVANAGHAHANVHSGGTTSGQLSVSTSGSGTFASGSFNVVQPSILMNYIIKT